MEAKRRGRSFGLAALFLSIPSMAFCQSASGPGSATVAAAAPSNVQMPGGALDPVLLGVADAYVTRPATARAGAACKAASTYVDRVQARQYEKVVDLFASDAVLMEPGSRRPHVGRDQIDSFFRNVIGPMKPQIVAVTYVGEGSDCFVELAVELPVNGQPRYVLTSVDHFTIEESGAITRMIAFSRALSATARTPSGN